MKKKIMVLAGAVVLLAVLVGVYFVVNGKADAEKEAAETLLDLTADRIQAISWTPEGGDALSFHRVDGQWSYDGDKDFKVDQTAMNTVCSGVTGITLYQTMEDVTDLAQYGLDTPEYMLEITDTEGKTTEIAIGADNEAVSSLYVYKDGDKSKVYAVMASLKTSIAKQLADLEAAEESSGEELPDES
ncbi:MAG: DUF4340 domain-containing protein [Lachnospiraceae bacterium]|nr:DUF4340 domain-containing protein [Lachnospiraceae bacterium]